MDTTGAAGGHPAPREDERTQRTMRFAQVIDRKVQDLGTARGIDLHAAVCVAVAEDWRRTVCRVDS